MSSEHDGQLSQFTANRRDVIRTATSLAAAAVAGGALVGTAQQANAQGNPKNSRLFCEIEDIGQFDLLSFSWGMENEIDSGSGGGGAGRRMTKAHIIAELVTSSATPKLQLACANGRHFARAVITQTDNRGSGYLVFTFEDVSISSVSISVDSRKGEMIDVVSFSFATVARLVVGSEGYEWNFGTNTGGPIG